MTQEIRCVAEHPRLQGRVCNAKLADVMDGSVAVVRAVELVAIGPGCALLACSRCGAGYVLCPRPAGPAPVAHERTAS